MKRPHRSIETFDISLMAVVTKAMGAFLVLMLLLIPYYSSSPLGKDEAEDLAKKVQDADAKIKGVLDKLGDKELGKDLSLAREQLGSGEQLIGQLKRYVDQLSSQVTRLEERITTLTAERDKLKKDNDTLTARAAELEKENAELKAENDKLKARIADLEKTIEGLNARIAELEKSEPEKVEELKKKIEELEKEVASLKQEIADLKSEVASLESENAGLKDKIAALTAQVAQLNALVAPLQQENAQLKARIAELEKVVAPLQQENETLKAKIAELQAQLKDWTANSAVYLAKPVLAGDAQSADCKDFALGLFSTGMTVGDPPERYVLNYSDGYGTPYLGRPFSGKYISTFAYSSATPGRYFVVLTSRVAPPQTDGKKPAGQNGGAPPIDGKEDAGGKNGGVTEGGGSNEGEVGKKVLARATPLQPPSRACTAIVSLIFSAMRQSFSNLRSVTLKPGEPIEYFADAVIGDDWSFALVDPSDEGRAWLKDQLEHAEVVAPDAPAAPSGIAPNPLPSRVMPPGFTGGDRPLPGAPGTVPPGLQRQRPLPGGQPIPGAPPIPAAPPTREGRGR